MTAFLPQKYVLVSLAFVLAVSSSARAYAQERSVESGWCAAGVSTPPSLDAVQAWGVWGGSPDNLRARTAGETSLSPDALPHLRLRWVFAIPDVGDMRSQPAVAGEWVFLAGRDGKTRALHRETGCIRWERALGAPLRSATVLADVGDDHPGVITGDDAGRVHALDGATGEVLWSVSVSGHPHAWVTGAPQPHDGRIYIPVSSMEVGMAQAPSYECCTFRGGVVALDATTGDILWEYHTIEEVPARRGTNAVGTTQWGPSGAPVWSSITVDAHRGRLYLGVGENYSHPGTNASSAIHAIDMETGRRQWIFQATEGDVWNMACSSVKVLSGLPADHSANCPKPFGPDFDFGAPPMLMSFGDDQQILIAGQKSGVVFGLDPDRNGAVVWQTRVGRGGLLGGVHWGMAAQHDLVLVPVSDRYDGLNYALEPAPAIVALDARTGELVWVTPAVENVCMERPGCHQGFSAPVTAVPGAVIAPSLDGHVYAFSTDDGRLLWRFNTAQRFESVNGAMGHGGSIDVAGPVVVGDEMYLLSGYETFGQMRGNVLLAFSLEL